MTKEELDALQALKHCPFCGKTESVRLTTTHEAWDDEGIYQDCAVVVCDASSAAKLGGCGASSSCHETEAEAIAAWNRRAAPESAGAWISVDEALPDSEVSVLIAMKDGRIEKTCYYYCGFLRSSAAQPTHWMPLPAPPIRADGKEGEA